MSRRVTGALSGLLQIQKPEESQEEVKAQEQKEQGAAEQSPEDAAKSKEAAAKDPKTTSSPQTSKTAPSSASGTRPSKPATEAKKDSFASEPVEEGSYFGLLKDEVKRQKTAEQKQTKGDASPQEIRSDAWTKALGEKPLFLREEDDLPQVSSGKAKPAETTTASAPKATPSKAPHPSSAAVGKRPPVDRPASSVKHPRSQEAAQTEQVAAVAEQIQKDPFEDLPRVGLRLR